MSRITDQTVLKYIAESAESIIEDGEWTDEEHSELKKRAFEWISRAHKGEATL